MSAAQTKYLGDDVLIYFVYPQAHEGDAERAVRAGLELIEAVTAPRCRALSRQFATKNDRRKGARREK